MSATHYHSTSRGSVEIASMNFNHLQNARNKLMRDGDLSRSDELQAINERIDTLNTEYEAEQAVSHG